MSEEKDTMTEYIKCGRCKHLFRDYSVGYSECTKEDLMTDLEFAEYEEFGGVLHCPYFEEDPSDLIDPSDDPSLDWPDENWPTISEYEIHKKVKN